MYKRGIFTILLLMATFAYCFAQTDTLNREGYKKWSKYKTLPRIGIGAQRAFYTELGITRHKFSYNELGYASIGYYGAVEWSPTIMPVKDRNILGFKTGCEINARALALGIEAKYQTDFRNNDIVLTPKIGFGLMGLVNLFYGYNISFNGSPVSKVGHNQFSLVLNLRKINTKRN